MASLIRLYDEQGQSPWLDNLTRPSLRDGTMADLIARGVRGVTANPTIVAKAIESSDAYDQQLHELLAAGHTVEDVYWDLVDRRRRRRPEAAAADLRGQRGCRRVRLDRGGARAGQRHSGNHEGRPRPARTHRASPTCWSRSLPRPPACPLSRRWSRKAAASTSP